MELGEDIMSVDWESYTETDVPACSVDTLSSIFDRGEDFVNAYATLLLVIRNSRGASDENMIKKAKELRPELSDLIDEAADRLTL